MMWTPVGAGVRSQGCRKWETKEAQPVSLGTEEEREKRCDWLTRRWKDLGEKTCLWRLIVF